MSMDEDARRRLMEIVNGRNLYGEFVPGDGGRPGGITRAEQMQAANTLLQAETATARITTEARVKTAELEMNERLRLEELRQQEAQQAARLELERAEAQARVELEREKLQLDKARLLVEVLQLATNGSAEAKALLGPLQASVLGLPAPESARDTPGESATE